MMWLIGLLTAVLLLDAVLLILLVLVQLPKKEAGMGQAFGGAATDALFGAGSGNALTKMTKWTAGIFFVLTFSISLLFNHTAQSRSTLGKEMEKLGASAKPPKSAATSGAASNAAATTATNVPLLIATNAAAAATNPTAAPAPEKAK